MKIAFSIQNKTNGAYQNKILVKFLVWSACRLLPVEGDPWCCQNHNSETNVNTDHHHMACTLAWSIFLFFFRSNHPHHSDYYAAVTWFVACELPYQSTTRPLFFPKVDMGSLTCTVNVVCVMHQEVRQAPVSLLKCWLKRMSSFESTFVQTHRCTKEQTEVFDFAPTEG